VKLTVPPLFRGAIRPTDQFRAGVALALNDKDGWTGRASQVLGTRLSASNVG